MRWHVLSITAILAVLAVSPALADEGILVRPEDVAKYYRDGQFASEAWRDKLGNWRRKDTGEYVFGYCKAFGWIGQRARAPFTLEQEIMKP